MHSLANNNNNNNIHNSNMAASSNNSINENRYNSEKLAKSSAVYRLKKILKPLVTLLKSKKAQAGGVARRTESRQEQRKSIVSYLDEFDCDYDNDANERLEAQLIAQLESASDDAAIFVYGEGGQQLHLQPLQEELYVPVHFARTEAGTFFWTAMPPARDVDEDLIHSAHCYSDGQCAQQAYADRWAQA